MSVNKVGRPKRVITNPCVVCGDVALSFNFGVESCESCKAFFRRNAFHKDKLKCQFDGNCAINKKTRKFCSFCRILKCFNRGMQVSLIHKENIESRKSRKPLNKLAKSSASFSASRDELTNTRQSMDSNESDIENGAEKLEKPDLQQICLKTSTQNDELIFISGSTDDNSIFRSISVHHYDTVKALQDAYDSSFCTPCLQDRLPESVNPTISSLVNSSGFMVKKLISFAKRLADFVVLDQQSQISLLKGVFLATLFIRSAAHYDPEKDAWVTSSGDEVQTKILKIATGEDSELYEEHAKFCRDFRVLCQEDRNLVSLMQVLCLFSPDRPGLKGREWIWSIYDRFVMLLKYYLEAKHGFTKSTSLFSAAISILSYLQGILQAHGHILGLVDPSKLDPLILEVFDLGFISQYNQRV